VSRPGAVFAARNHPSPTSGARPQKSLPDSTGRCASGGNAGRRVLDTEAPGRALRIDCQRSRFQNISFSQGCSGGPTCRRLEGSLSSHVFVCFLVVRQFKKGSDVLDDDAVRGFG
jgi:hypothetical protein